MAASAIAGAIAKAHSSAGDLGVAVRSTRRVDRRIITCATTAARTADQKMSAATSGGIECELSPLPLARGSATP